MSSTLFHKYLCLVLALLCYSPFVQSQVVNAPEVISLAGDHYQNDEIEMSWTIGQFIIQTTENEPYILTQGFHQSEDRFLNVEKAVQQQLVITPNDDGLNDAFVLEDLQNFSDNELLIMNRWGSIVFSQSPYLNDWRGTNNNGGTLPEGTYYFVLRLNPAEGDFLYGSITIKR